MTEQEQDLINVVTNIAFINGAKKINVLLPPDLRPLLPQEIRNKFELIQIPKENHGQT